MDSKQGAWWYESLPEGRTWDWLWFEYVRCGCGGIGLPEGICSACGKRPSAMTSEMLPYKVGGEPSVRETFMGSEGRYEDFVYLQMLEREWARQDLDLYESIPEGNRPSARAIVVLVFWTYFETRIERLFRQTAWNVPPKVLEHLLERYPMVGRRITHLYKLVYSTTYLADLNAEGYGRVAELLRRVQEARNSFAHGQPRSIDDALVETWWPD